jgi:hypothetical protein
MEKTAEGKRVEMVEYTEGLSPNYDQLKNDASNRGSWRIRLAAVTELSKWKCQQSKDILWKSMMNKREVYRVRYAAFLGLQAFGESVRLPRKGRGNFVEDIRKHLTKIKHSLPQGHTFEDFKNEFKKIRPIEYDLYEGEENKFDSWLENTWRCLPKQK